LPVTDALRKELPLESGPTTVESHPQVFVRAIVTPPAPPWEQTRAANLEARHGAPLPLAELLHRVKRLAPWAPGRPGRFGVFYVHAKEFRAPFETEVEVDGQSVKVAFGRAGDQVQRAQGWAVILLLFVLTGAGLGTGLVLATGARAQAEARLATAEKLGAERFAAAQAYRRQVAQARELRLALGRGRSISDLVGDLTWVATSKTPEARLAAVHWQGGVMAVEVRGEQPPFAAPDRRLERAAHPLRAGVWLWGIGAKQAAADRPSSTLGALR